MDSQETRLRGLPGVPDDVIRKLEQRWITSADQLVALGATQANLKALAAELGVSDDEAALIVSAARRALDPAKADALQRPVDTSKYPLGATKPGKSAPDE